LAIGLVVDDAIIVVENVNRYLATGLSAIDAARRAAAELLQPILAMTVVLIAAYVPLGLQGGLTGALFTEFAFTLAGAVTMSALLALTLSPMMSSRLLRARAADGERVPLGERIERGSEHGFEVLARWYGAALRLALDLRPVVLVLGVLVLGSSWYFYGHARHELSPREDTGQLRVTGSASPATTLDAMGRYDATILAAFTAVPEMRHYWLVDVPGDGVFSGISLKPWDQRHRSIFTIGDEVQAALSRVPGVELASYPPPYLPGSHSMPISFVVQGTGNVTQLAQVADAMLAKARASGLFSYIDKDLKIDQPQMTVVVDRGKLSALGMTMNDLGSSLNAMLGGGYTGFFSTDQRSYKVEPLAMRQFRLNPDQILLYPVKSANGVSVPLASVASVRESVVPESISHFQQLDSTTLEGLPAPGVTQGEAYDAMRRFADEVLPQGFTTDTDGALRQYVQETGGFAATFALAVVITYLALAALFESFLDPLIILVSVPMSLAGALLFVWTGVGGATINLFTEVGLVTLMGLISKHGILIVEVAKESQALGYNKRAAIERACALRLRPILMTTAAMVLGVMPLVLANGAGAASRFVMGLVIASGLAIGTLFTLFVLPAVYMLLASDRSARVAAARVAVAAD
ncbi:MAG: efflux RND transporter permease subunit, partial [Gluconacetobacter diazotrophicus]|nr:efflux RND transporter permease subunit [Gluconacetobacter diazotrophicus]